MLFIFIRTEDVNWKICLAQILHDNVPTTILLIVMYVTYVYGFYKNKRSRTAQCAVYFHPTVAPAFT